MGVPRLPGSHQQVPSEKDSLHLLPSLSSQGLSHDQAPDLYARFFDSAIGLVSTHGASAFQASEFRLLATSNPILAPGIQYETTILNAQINVPFEFNTISSGYYNFAINPPLPDGVFFSTITGKIYGSTSTSGTQSYQVTAFNSAGQVVSTTITINVSGMSLFFSASCS